MRNREDYPAEWYDTIRPKILMRDKYKCRQCGIKHRQWIAKKKTGEIIKIDSDEVEDYDKNTYKVYRIYLHVCHRDNNKQNIEESNLITLCVTHHARLDSSYKMMIRKGNKVKKQMTIFDVITQAHPCPPQEPHAPLGSFGSHHS